MRPPLQATAAPQLLKSQTGKAGERQDAGYSSQGAKELSDPGDSQRPARLGSQKDGRDASLTKGCELSVRTQDTFSQEGRQAREMRECVLNTA